ncbi:hypothetical protein BGZ83_004450, partial [Gryganskiella cystojenkinii]
MDKDIKTVLSVFEEWRFGYNSLPAVQDLNTIYASHWNFQSDPHWYQVFSEITK